MVARAGRRAIGAVNPRARVRLPDQVRRGETFVVRTLISHRMESGLHRDASGERIPRDIVTRFVCRFEGDTVFAVDLDTAIAANPYFEFHMRATRSGRLAFEWTETTGRVTRLERWLEVGA